MLLSRPKYAIKFCLIFHLTCLVYIPYQIGKLELDSYCYNYRWWSGVIVFCDTVYNGSKYKQEAQLLLGWPTVLPQS